MSDNLSLWNSVCETNPSHTKEVNFGRKITAIDPYQQIKNATEKFGPAGKGWGWEVMDVAYPPNHTVAVRVRLWHGDKGDYVEQWGQNGIFTDKKKTIDDKDCMKKATTDGITKCLSMLGFNADVFLGKFDDNKYVAEMRAKEAAKEAPAEQELTPAQKEFNTIRQNLINAPNDGVLENVWADSEEERKKLPPAGQAALMDVYHKKKAQAA